MTLREYLFFNRIKQIEFAKKVRISKAYLSNIIQEKKKPSFRLAEEIERATNFEVRFENICCTNEKSAEFQELQLTNG